MSDSLLEGVVQAGRDVRDQTQCLEWLEVFAILDKVAEADALDELLHHVVGIATR